MCVWLYVRVCVCEYESCYPNNTNDNEWGIQLRNIIKNSGDETNLKQDK